MALYKLYYLLTFLLFSGTPCVYICLCDIKSFCDNAGHEDEIYTKLKEVKNLIVYKKENIDPSFHYKNNRRIMPLIVSAVEGYRLCKNATNCTRELGKVIL